MTALTKTRAAMSVNWNIEEMEAHEDEIVGKGLTVLKVIHAKLAKGGHPWDTEAQCATYEL
jgi:hypothetical protein